LSNPEDWLLRYKVTYIYCLTFIDRPLVSVIDGSGSSTYYVFNHHSP